MVILDTSIVIDHLRQHPSKESNLDRINKSFTKDQIALSVISIQELYARRSTKDEEVETLLLATVTPLKILPYTYEVAQLAGEIARDLEHPVELADAAIAATAILNGYQLITLDKNDFKDIKELVLID